MSGRAGRARRAGLLAAVTLVAGVWGVAPAGVGAQSSDTAVLDGILDQYVRDGFVYYASLRAERGAIDRYVQSLAEQPAGFEAWSAGRRLAYWINGYNALVLRTVIDHYPIRRGGSADFPDDSVMQIPGMFSGREHLIAGRRLTLQAIEDELIAPFGDPRAHLALGRGAVGSPRLRSEAFSDDRLEAQLQAVVADFATTPRHVTLDQAGDELVVSAVLGWQADQLTALAGADDGTGRSPIEQAIVALISPALFASERAFLARNAFRLRYRDFDWRLNDLTGGAPTPLAVRGPGRRELSGQVAHVALPRAGADRAARSDGSTARLDRRGRGGPAGTD